ncbi:MAG: SDR family oxidoreductase [Bythopirellula sp.]|nr:SDR family oxidoreductase [Bythopirellula sp.]
MQSLKNKNALVTGGATGIGRAIALRLAQEGVHLFLVDIDPVGLSEVVAAAKQSGVSAKGRVCDVGQLEEITASVQHGLNCYGRFDLLVNNAGITYYGRTDQMSAEHCEQLLAVNVHAPLHFTRLLLPTLLEQPEAHVLNVSSFLGLIGVRKLAAYSASKFALVGFSEALRAEFARTNLGVTAFCPGFVETSLFESAPLGCDRHFPKRPPRWMLSTAEKVAARAVKAIQRDESLVVMQHYAKLTHFTKRFFPGLIDFANHLTRKRFTAKLETPPTAEERRAAA